MSADKKIRRAERQWGKSNSKETRKKVVASDIIEEKPVKTASEANVSVLTKTTNPKIIVESENLKNSYDVPLCNNSRKHGLLKSVFFIVICIIILMMFFLTIRIYNMVDELLYLHSIP